ncbi:MAG TPA: N-6 DNA methylase [Deltaproteobacteria bacterium]|nr:MAG: N-6 DNA methylase [Deltaproteobacteria bacterium RIFCSPHIGHO2_02_FULL_42_44]OGQ65793.1 MAG: N-6 DNA methylase [Deltaproteobacteria bacterium RIFCSPLOWO2_12_FULL_42_16]HAG50780.1 N-6 DNA methylase [Deltaproteobacteria bacterium]
MAFKIKKKKTSNGGNLGFEEKLWQAADKMRGHMDPAEYKHVVLGLIFLKYISDAFEERRSQLESSAKDPSSEYYVKEPEARYGIIEDRDEYLSENIFWVPKDARWSYLQANAKQPTIGKIIDDAMVVIEKENSKLKGVLPKDYARPTLDKHTLGELIDLIATIGLGDAESRSKDILGRVYEYFLGRFASAEGKGGGEFYTPQSVVKILVEMIEPYKGRVYDPCCGSGGMFVQSEKFIEAHGGRKGDISIYGQESNPTTWRLCNMNLAIRGIEGNIGSHHADTFRQDIQKDLKADFILANPPFNVSDWKGELLREDVRWRYGTPPVSNANFAWVQHFIHHLSPNGIAGFVLANGSMSSNQSGEGDIRKNIIEADLVDCMIALPGQLFYTTPIPACLWFLTRNKKNSLPAALRTAQAGKFRDRRCQTLFIDARKMGHLIDRTHRELSDEEITRIANTYHAWRGEKDAAEYKDIPGFCKSATIEEIKAHGYVLTPGRYVGAEDIEEDDEPFNEKMKRLTAKLEEEFAESVKLEALIKRNLREFGVACLCHGRQE